MVKRVFLLALGATLSPVAIAGHAPGDCNGNGVVDPFDYQGFKECLSGPVGGLGVGCACFDLDDDIDVDLEDASFFWTLFDAILPPPATCGNGVIDAGEQCDDGNNTNGDGCSASCLIEGGPPPNDLCSNPTPVSDGTTPFDTSNAETDGPPEPSCGFLFADPQIGADIWYTYVATCDGEALASLCGSSYDSKIAVYGGDACPVDAPITCSDDDCGINNFNARVTFTAVAGASYLIRVGGFSLDPDTPDTGTGTLSVRCGEDPCGGNSGACFEAHDHPGCDDAECCATTCDVDPFCCDVAWDTFCADEAAGLCSGTFAACNDNAGTCTADNGGQGCDDVECCNSVCLFDPFCCVDAWDDICAREAFDTCFLACGDSNSGGCFVDNKSPGCDNKSCCERVCNIDSYCCTDVWDQFCADIAATECR